MLPFAMTEMLQNEKQYLPIYSLLLCLKYFYILMGESYYFFFIPISSVKVSRCYSLLLCVRKYLVTLVQTIKFTHQLYYTLAAVLY